jgi:phosphoribosyl-dephospho-CoA transferase
MLTMLIVEVSVNLARLIDIDLMLQLLKSVLRSIG